MGQPYLYVVGTWNVPSIDGYDPYAFTYSAEWVGLDGGLGALGSQDVVQDGTEQDTFWFGFNGVQWVFDDFYAWIEFFPDSELPILNFQVSPSDQIWSQVTYDSGIGVYWMENISAQTYFFYGLRPPSGTTFLGDSAEWIMERPQINDSLPELSPYGFTVMCGFAYARYLTGAGIVDAAADGNINVRMYNGSDLLSAAYRWGSDTDSCMYFHWYNVN
jgi:hypothetical protein